MTIPRNELCVSSDNPFHLTFMDFDPKNYSQLLNKKIENLKIQFLEFEGVKESFQMVDVEVYQSPTTHYRQKCRFALKMKHPHNPSYDLEKIDDKLYYTMWENGFPSVIIESFPIASEVIYSVMPAMIIYINESRKLSIGLQAIHFLSTLTNELLVTLLYDSSCVIFEDSSGTSDFPNLSCHEVLLNLRNYLMSSPTISNQPKSIDIICRRKGEKFVLGKSFVTEEFQLADGRTLRYIQVEDGFSNPNAHVNKLALDWICSVMESIHRDAITPSSVPALNPEAGSELDALSLPGVKALNFEDASAWKEFDVLELYCGNGNHTVAIAGYCKRLLAVEINPSLCRAAEENLQMNEISNAKILNCPSEKFANRILRNRSYCDSTGEVYDFRAVLVDPPRCGLDDVTRSLIQNYENIVYVSCNPAALMRDLSQLTRTHSIQRFAAFDQFAYTPHLECITFLKQKK